MKKGFTLAEILITLTIVGVVAALTLPALTTNVSQAKIGPALAKFVNTFENGTRNCMQENEISSFSDIDVQAIIDDYVNGRGDKDVQDALKASISNDMGGVFDILSPYVIMSEPDSNSDVIKNYKYGYSTGSKRGDANIVSGNNIRILKDGMLIFAPRASAYTSSPFYYKDRVDGTPLKGARGIIYVDINGTAKPNMPAKDMFAFVFDKSGLLVPVGSSMHKQALGNSDITCDPDAEEVLDRYYCTGKIADNGWKADY